MRFPLAGVLVALALAASPAHALLWSASVDDERGGTLAIESGGARVLSSAFAFWGKDWSWADQRLDFKIVAPMSYAMSGRNRTLGFSLDATVRAAAANRLVWRFELDAPRTTPDVIGGGISFKFDTRAGLGEPQLLPDNRGWVWGTGKERRVRLEFDPPLASVYFEPGGRSEIRAFFYKGSVPAGKRSHSATLTLSGNVEVAPTLNERMGVADHRVWPTGLVDWRSAAVDLSFLNAAERPAGKRGFLRRAGDKLVFDDGTPASFWGTTVTSYALFTAKRESVQQQARRLSQLGFNLVRLHHHDSYWVHPNIFGGKDVADTQSLSSTALDSIDWWIKCLKDEGIYVWLDLHVQRSLKPGDAIDGYEEVAKARLSDGLRGFNYVNASIARAMKKFNEDYVGHGNRFTGLRYRDDPAIVAMLVTNENDITHHFGNVLLPDKRVPKHTALYMAEAAAFAAHHGLPKDKTWRSWEPGPAKLFLNDLEQRFHADLIAHLRGRGVKVPVAATSTWGFNPISSLPALTAGDFIDVHSYGGPGELERNPLDAASMVHWIAAAQVAGMPLTVSEWNVERFPVADRAAMPLYMAANARLQGWRAVLLYAYSQGSFNSSPGPSNWEAATDPSLLATLPAAALLYRTAHVRESQAVYAFAPTREQMFYGNVSPRTSVALRTAAEAGKLLIVPPATRELPWLQAAGVPSGARVITNPDEPLIANDAVEAVSDTKELRRNWKLGTYMIDTALTQAAMGWIGGKKIALGDVEIAASTRHGAIAVQSLDAKPIAASRSLLISVGARSLPQSEGQLPFHSEPVIAHLSVRAPPGLKLYRRGAAGERQEIPVSYRDGRYRIILDGRERTYWFTLG